MWSASYEVASPEYGFVPMVDLSRTLVRGSCNFPSLLSLLSELPRGKFPSAVCGRSSLKWRVHFSILALAYYLANFMRTLALSKTVAHWSLTSLGEKLVKIGAKIVTHARYVTFQMAEVAVPRELFQPIAELRPPPVAAPAQRILPPRGRTETTR